VAAEFDEGGFDVADEFGIDKLSIAGGGAEGFAFAEGVVGTFGFGVDG